MVKCLHGGMLKMCSCLFVLFVCVCAILSLHVSDTTKHVFQYEQRKTHLSDPVSWWINCLHMGTCFNFWMQFPNKSRCLSKCCVNQEQQPYIFFPRLPICRQNDWFATGLWIPSYRQDISPDMSLQRCHRSDQWSIILSKHETRSSNPKMRRYSKSNETHKTLSRGFP